ncbi:MAG TPA: VWA domain-containing protein, partial [Polyangia bacterium]
MSAWHFTLHGQPAGFAQPWALCLAACALVVGALFVARAVGGRTRVSRWVSPRLMPRLLPDRPRLRRALASGFSVVGIALLCVALARPLWGAHEEAAARRGIDVVVALDASRSMLATDVAPNRMARAKLELETLLSGLQGDRVGLVTFA